MSTNCYSDLTDRENITQAENACNSENITLSDYTLPDPVIPDPQLVRTYLTLPAGLTEHELTSYARWMLGGDV